MEYQEAYKILNNNADANKLFSLILKGDNSIIIEYIKQITGCDDIIAKAIAFDLADGLISKKNNNNIPQQQNIPHCPKCGSINIQMVQRKWSPLTGFMTNKVDRVCVNCKHKF